MQQIGSGLEGAQTADTSLGKQLMLIGITFGIFGCIAALSTSALAFHEVSEAFKQAMGR